MLKLHLCQNRQSALNYYKNRITSHGGRYYLFFSLFYDIDRYWNKIITISVFRNKFYEKINKMRKFIFLLYYFVSGQTQPRIEVSNGHLKFTGTALTF